MQIFTVYYLLYKTPIKTCNKMYVCMYVCMSAQPPPTPPLILRSGSDTDYQAYLLATKVERPLEGACTFNFVQSLNTMYLIARYLP